MQFVVYVSDTPVTLKQSQGHQTQNDNVDPKQIYNQTKFGRSFFTGVQEKVNNKVVCFFSDEEICQLSLLNKCECQKR